MQALDSLAAIALWGTTRVSRNREVLWSVLTRCALVAGTIPTAVVAGASSRYPRHSASAGAGSAGGAPQAAIDGAGGASAARHPEARLGSP